MRELGWFAARVRGSCLVCTILLRRAAQLPEYLIAPLKLRPDGAIQICILLLLYASKLARLLGFVVN